MKIVALLLLTGCTQIVFIETDGGELAPDAKLAIARDAQADGAELDAAKADVVDAASTPDTSAPDSGVVQDSGVLVDSGADSGVKIGTCHVVNYSPRDCDGTPQQDFYVIESCGMNCTMSTPCLQKNPHCPIGYTCAIYNINTKKLDYGTCQ